MFALDEKSKVFSAWKAQPFPGARYCAGAMSQENVENVRRGIDAWNRGDLDEWLGCFAPDAELHTTGRFADQGVYRGHAGLQRYWTEVWGGHRGSEPFDFRLAGCWRRVFFAVTGRGRGKRGKVPVERPIWFVTTLRDGLAVRVETYVDPSRKPSKPQGPRSRRCRRRIWRSPGDVSTPGSETTSAPFWPEIDPDVVWHTAIEGTAEGEDMVYRGHDGARPTDLEGLPRRGVQPDRAYRRPSCSTSAMRSCDSVVIRVTGQASGVEIESELAQHVVMRDGLIVSSRDYLGHAEALEAAGLRE